MLNGSKSASSFIYTFAGNGANGYSGDGGPATKAWLNDPGPAVMDSAGNLYFSDQENHVVRKVAAGTGMITTIAGTGIPGYSGDGGPATSAQFYYPETLAIDTKGNLYINDEGNAVVRKVDAANGIITTYAGNGSVTVSGDGGPATSAGIGYVGGLAVDGAGNLYLAEEDSDTIREVAASTGIINTIAGTGIFGYSGDGGPALSAKFYEPYGLAIDGAGDLYISDSGNQVIRMVSKATGNISTVAGNGTGAGGFSGGFAGDGGPATSAELNHPQGIVLDGSGNLYIADSSNNRIRRVTASTGIITTVAGDGNCDSLSGDGGPATSAALCYPFGVASEKSGNLLVSDESNRIHEVTAAANPPTMAAATPVFSVAPGTYAGSQVVTVSDATLGTEIYITMDGSAATTTAQGYNGPINVNGNATISAIAAAPGYLPSASASASYLITSTPPLVIDTVAGNGQMGSSSQGGQAFQAQLGYPSSVALDQSKNLYIADGANEVVWIVSGMTGNISIFAGNGIAGFSGDNGPATSAELYDPQGVAVDTAGNLYIADTYNNRVRKVAAATGIMTTVAGNGQTGYSGHTGDGGPATSAELAYPEGVALDGSGNLYIADTDDDDVRMVTASTGIISTVAGNGFFGRATGDGGPATSAVIGEPVALAFDSTGDLFIATPAVGRVRQVAAGTGIISTVAGSGSLGGTGDGGPATQAEVNPWGIAVDDAGNLYIANFPDTIRKVDAQTGVISRYAGNGYSGYSGDGGSATVASLCGPHGIAFDASGNLYVADQCNFRVREISPPNPVATPVFSLAAGSYKGTQSVTVTDTTPKTTIFFTTDGSTPSTASTEYSGPISVSATETLNAIAVAPGYTESAMAAAAYVITPGPATPTVTWSTPASINYGTPLSGAQLDATASVPGTFSYSPAAGTVLSTGQHTLTVTFTPNDTTDYTTVTASVTLVVNPFSTLPVLASLSPAFAAAGGSAFTLTIGGSGFQPSSTVYWGTTALSTQFVSGTQLQHRQ